MPTIQGIDSFQHRILPVAINATNGWYSNVNGGGTLPNHGGGGWSFDTGNARTVDHAVAAKMVTDGAGTFGLRRTIAATVVVGSVYFKCSAAPASGAVKLVNAGLSAGVASVSLTNSGFIQTKVGTGTAQTGSTNYCDGAWHLLDFKFDTSTGTATADAKVDGVTDPAVQATLALASANMTTIMVGDNTASPVVTIYFSDFVWSVTSGDYPLGHHICLGSTINATGTHNKGAGTWADEAGNTTDVELLNSVDDAWNGTTPELSQTGEDYVVKSAGVTATEYLEFGIEDAAAIVTTVWGAQLGCLIAALDSTTANTQEARLVDSGGTTLATPGALLDASISATAYSAYRAYATAAPSGGWASGFNGCLVRWGFTNDVTPNPVFNAAFVEYVGPWSAAVAVATVIPRVTVPQIGSNPQNIGPI